MNNITILDKNKCTGCRMCEQICPVNAIKMVENGEGFLEPEIIENKCINCGLCAKRCPQLNELKFNKLKEVQAYAAKNKNMETQKQSSSGGLFSNFADYVFYNNGVIYGCVFNKDIKAEHIRIDNKEELYKLRGSKYVQSDTKDTFKQVKQDLENGKTVLYTGTPCQISGLKQFLGRDYDKLITIDLVCHGVPSPELFQKYIKYLEEKYGSKIVEYQFRSKEKNVWGLNLKIKFYNDKVKYIPMSLDPYYKTFIEGKNYRECCYNCKYANENRIGDITIADYWGIEKEHPEFYDEKGVSAIILNTEKGLQIWNEINEQIAYIPSTIEKVKNKNHNLNMPTERTSERENIYKNLNNKEFRKYIKEDLKFKYKTKDIIKNLIPVNLKRTLKNLKRGISK